MTQTLGNTTATTVTKLQDDGCTMIPANGPFGNKTVGPRTVIVMADPLEWDANTSYEYMTLVTNNGNSYISKKDVPAGTPLTNDEYWIKSSDWNAQLSNIEKNLDNMVIVPKMFGDKSSDDTQIVNLAIATGLTVDGRGETYNISSIESAEPIKFQNINFSAIEEVDSLIKCPRGSYFINCKIDGKGLCNNIIETTVSDTASTLSTSIISCEFYSSKNSIVKAGSAIQTDLCQFSMSENGIICNCSDNKIFTSIFYNCRTAINCPTGSGGTYVDNCHAWVTRSPSQCPYYVSTIDNTDYPGTSCFFKLGSEYPNINIGTIYVDTLTYTFIIDSKSPTYSFINVNKINGFINTSFYNSSDPQPVLMNNNKLVGNNNLVFINHIFFDYNNLTGPDGNYASYLPTTFTEANASLFIVKNYYSKSTKNDISYYQFSPYYRFASSTEADKLGAFSIYPVIVKEGNISKIMFRAGINEPIGPNETIATITWPISIQYSYPSRNVYFMGVDGSIKQLDTTLNGAVLTITNGDTTLQNGIIIAE